jgi:aspartyl/asparaginyl beta-hydroxylase (cupin superfamily)
MTDEERSESERLLALLDSATAEFGRDALQRLAGPIRAVAGVEPRAETGEELRYPSGLFVPGLKSAAWHGSDFVPDVAILERSAPAMRSEVESLLARRGGFQPFDEGNYGFNPANTDGQWNVFYLFLGCREVPGAAEQCPRTAEALRGLPNLAMSAMFSALTPGTHLWAHCGPTNVVVSLSLGLIVPTGSVIRVGTEERTWHAGECLVFDDTYEHEVWNRGGGTRFVMLLDVWHPELTQVERTVVARALWAPGEAESRLGQRKQQALAGTDWWVAKADG